jgi:hypothetical protein
MWVKGQFLLLILSESICLLKLLDCNFVTELSSRVSETNVSCGKYNDMKGKQLLSFS